MADAHVVWLGWFVSGQRGCDRREGIIERHFEMTRAQAATADVFLTALKALPKVQRDAVLVRIARDKAFARDLLDLATIAKRRGEPARPFAGYVSDKNG